MNDIENDRNIIFTLRTDTIGLVHKLQDFQKKEAFAIEQGDLLTQVPWWMEFHRDIQPSYRSKALHYQTLSKAI